MGLAHQRLGQVDKAIEYHEQALVICREIGARRREGIMLWSLGKAYFQLGQVDKAIEYKQQDLAIAREIGDKIGQGMGLSSLGDIYYTLRQMEQAIEYYEQALVIYHEAGYRLREWEPLKKLGIVYREMGQVEQAVEFYQQALAVARELDDQRREGVVLIYLGNAHRLMGRYKKALTCFDQAIELNPDSDWGYYERGLIHLIKNNRDQARNDFSQAISLARQRYEENSQNWRNTFNLALYSLAFGDIKTAEQLYQEAIGGSHPRDIIHEVVRDLDDFLNLFPNHSQAQAMCDLLQQSL
jgi:tetratricopeptide (TPR) repeat protein